MLRISRAIQRNMKSNKLFRCVTGYRNNPQISILVQLAGSLAVELGLNTPVSRKSTKQLALPTHPPSCEGAAISQHHSSEEMRAYLGYFYLNSV